MFASSNEAIYQGKPTKAYLGTALRSLVVKVRKSFNEKAFEEILHEVASQWCPHANVVFRCVTRHSTKYRSTKYPPLRAQGLLSLFLPNSSALELLAPVVAQIFERWPWFGKCCLWIFSELYLTWPKPKDCNEWDYHWLSLLGRVAKASNRSADKSSLFSPYLPTIYTHALRVLGICYRNCTPFFYIAHCNNNWYVDVSLGGAALPKLTKTRYPLECNVFSPRHMVDLWCSVSYITNFLTYRRPER